VITLCECFCRDGLQHEPGFILTEAKIGMLARLVGAGFRRVEITSFAHPTAIPQFADAEAVLAGTPRPPGVLFKATCPNPRAVERALAAHAAGHGPEEISFLTSATEAHSARNLRRTRAEQWENIAAMARLAGITFGTVGTISVAFGCPFEGEVPLARVVEDAQRFLALGVTRIALGDTIGAATPPRIREAVRVLHAEAPGALLIAHLHDSRGTGLANSLAAAEAGVTHLDCALGGTGGHPAGIAYGEGFTGNTCTEDLAMALHAMGLPTGLDLRALAEAGRAAEALLGRSLHSRVLRMGAAGA